MGPGSGHRRKAPRRRRAQPRASARAGEELHGGATTALLRPHRGPSLRHCFRVLVERAEREGEREKEELATESKLDTVLRCCSLTGDGGLSLAHSAAVG